MESYTTFKLRDLSKGKIIAKKCQCCGAPLKSTKCEYCGTEHIIEGVHNMEITDRKKLENRRNDMYYNMFATCQCLNTGYKDWV